MRMCNKSMAVGAVLGVAVTLAVSVMVGMQSGEQPDQPTDEELLAIIRANRPEVADKFIPILDEYITTHGENMLFLKGIEVPPMETPIALSGPENGFVFVIDKRGFAYIVHGDGTVKALEDPIPYMGEGVKAGRTVNFLDPRAGGIWIMKDPDVQR